MYSIVFFGLLAFVAASPRHHHHHRSDYDDYFKDDIFDLRRFWREFRRDMSELENIFRRFKGNTCSEGIVGNEYKVSIRLRGFNEDDITVKAKKGLLIIQAMKGGPNSGKNYLDVRSLPDYVNEIGQWTYEDGVLNIGFPITGKPPQTVPRPSQSSDSDEDSDESIDIDIRDKPLKSWNSSKKHTVDSREDELIPAKY